MAFTSYAPKSRSMFTYVTRTGVTFSILGDGTLLGGTAPLAPRMRAKVVSGALEVSTPHRAGGAFSERAAGGIYPSVKASAKWLSLKDWIARDPRATEDDRAAVLAVLGN